MEIRLAQVAFCSYTSQNFLIYTQTWVESWVFRFSALVVVSLLVGLTATECTFDHALVIFSRKTYKEIIFDFSGIFASLRPDRSTQTPTFHPLIPLGLIPAITNTGSTLHRSIILAYTLPLSCHPCFAYINPSIRSLALLVTSISPDDPSV